MTSRIFKIAAAASAFAATLAASPAQADSNDLEAAFDRTFGTQVRAPQTFEARYDTPFERQIAQLADGTDGRIGVYAIDLSTGREIGVLADQRFPMASTSKVAVAAAYLAEVDRGRLSLTRELRLPRPGNVYVPAERLIELMISKSCNDCTDALITAIGGTGAVNRWMQGAGIQDFELTRNIRALISADGDVDPALQVDRKDSATPRAMGQLLAGIYQGRWLSAQSRSVIMNAMKQTTTGKKRMRSALPVSANLAHKTGTLARTASDIGIFYTPDGRPIAAAIYVTGHSPSMAVENGSRSEKLAARARRDAKISSITYALYDGFGSAANDRRQWADANYGGE